MWNWETFSNIPRILTEYLFFSGYIKQLSSNIYIAVFYILVGVVLLSALMIFYLGYSLSKKKMTITLPLLLLKGTLSLLLSILNLPIFEYFFSVIKCKSNTDQSTHIFYSEVVCWSGIHLLHSIVAIVISVLFLVFSLGVALIFFECRDIHTNPSAR